MAIGARINAGIQTVLLMGLSFDSLAATIWVSDISPSAVPNGLCSLIEAMENANADASVHADCAKGVGADTIQLAHASIYTLSTPHNTTYDATGLPVVESKITIDGNNSIIQRAGRKNKTELFRLIAVAEKGDLTLNEVALRGGATSWPPIFDHYPCGIGIVGAGILNFGTMVLNKSEVSGNVASAFNGGGIASTGRLVINNSSVSGNFSGDDGGGIASCGELTVNSSVISHNDANDIGGGLMVSAGLAHFDNSTVSHNSATTGAGIANSARLSIVGSTINDNVSGSLAWGSLVYGGGGMYNEHIATVFNSTISRNDAVNSSGGGVFNRGQARLVLVNTTVAQNSAGYGSNLRNVRDSQMDFQNALIADALGGGFDCINEGAWGVNINSLVEDGSCASAYIGDPALGALSENGGTTKTHALLAGSIAVDVGNAGICAAHPISNLDQRGKSRLTDGNSDGAIGCDIGSYEKSVGSISSSAK